ncbi:MAG TPA: polysaccharide pyruvyl transferase family protein [Chthoniobacteraceae bacterium]|nr:polysaccharide pyruvyl transferase family protein [Chthoniobacteraceae bacterium]
MNRHLFLAFSWTFGHVGDVGITAGFLRFLQERKPELPVRLLAWQGRENPEFSRAQSYYPQHHAPTEVYPNIFRELIGDDAPEEGAWRRLVGRWGRRRLENFERGCLGSREAAAMADDLLERFPLELYRELESRHPDLATLFSEAGFCLFNASTSLSFGRLGVRNWWGQTLGNAMPLLIARALKLPYGLSPQSIEAVDWPVDLVYRPLFREARFLYTRDSDSLLYLEQRRLLNRNSGFGADTTFFFNRPDTAWATEFLKTRDLAEGGFAVVMVRIPICRPGSPDPVANAIPPERLARLMDQNREVIEQWIARTGLKVLIAHEGADTIASAREHLWSLLSPEAKGKVVCLEEFWTTEQAFAVYQRARLMISMEIHSTFLALGAGTPVVHHPFVEAGRKMEVFRDLGLGDWLIDADEGSPGEILAAAFAIHENHTAAQARIAAVLPGLEAKAASIIAEIERNWRS